ncbi:hypothetical protein GLOIN_2v1841879 [Rhizophagus clarus]|uniref:Uncharacterized protein n=1 Tax=Rhizophagus clarus TaxID=94130 RepID=A0A8H3KXQ6_9GLOM|nr:hypothetical protein GLOIN_2v1841879 [Rhizophagus clarus]
MFLFESRPPFRTTEPKTFSILRFLTAIIFSIVLVFYTWISFGDFVSNFDKPTLYFSGRNHTNYTYPSFKICPKTLSNYNGDDSLNISLYKLYSDFSSSQLYVPNAYSFYDYKNNNKYDFRTYDFNQSYELYSNDSIPKNSDFFIRDHDNNRCRIFTPPLINSEFVNFVNIIGSPYYFNNNELLFIITLDNSSMYDFFEINFESFNISTESLSIIGGYSKTDVRNVILTTNQHFIVRGQYIIYESVIKTTSHTSPSFGMLGFKANNNSTDIEIEEKVLGLTPNASYTVLELRFKPDNLIYQEYKYQTVNKVVSNLGGFYSAISGVFFILFGASKLSPWGICQKWVCCWPYRRSFKRSLASRYVSRAGIPLAEDPRKLPPGAELRDRVAILEHLLKEYYIDAYYLEKLTTTRKRYLDIRKNNHETVRILDNDISDDDFTDDIALERLEGGSSR